MKQMFIIVLTLLFNTTLKAQNQQCFDFTQYTDSTLNAVIYNSQPGDIIVQQGDIALVHGDVPFFNVFIDTVANSLTYYPDPGELIIDVSSSNYNCKKLTFNSLAYQYVIDGDTIDMYGVNTYSGNGFNVSSSGGSYYEITGSFNQVTPLIQTNLLSNLCLEECSTPFQQCFDFTQYTDSTLNAIISNSQPGDIIAQQGDIALVYGDVLGFSVNIDTVANSLFYFPNPGELTIDVSSSNYNCKKLTFNSIANQFVIDGDTVDMTGISTYNGNGFNVNYSGGTYEVTGTFNQVTPLIPTDILSNLCLEDCSTSIVNEIQTSNVVKYVIYPNPLTSSDVLTIKGDVSFISNYFIINTLGEIVQSGNLNSNTINVSTINKGQFILMLQKHNELIPVRFMIVE